MLLTMSTSAPQRLLHRTVHVDDGIGAHVRLEKQVRLQDLTTPGVGGINLTPTSAVDNIFLFVDTLSVVLSFDTERDVDAGAPTSSSDGMRLFQNELRRLEDKALRYIVRFRADLTRGEYTDRVDTKIHDSLYEYFQQLVEDLDIPTRQLCVKFCTAPPASPRPESPCRSLRKVSRTLERSFNKAKRLASFRGHVYKRQCTSVPTQPRHSESSVVNDLDLGRYLPGPLHLVQQTQHVLDSPDLFRHFTDIRCRFVPRLALYPISV